LFADSVDSLAEADELLATASRDASTAARAECLTLRLNLARGELGWYSRTGSPEAFVWEHWDSAHRAYLAGDPRTAGGICRVLNRL
jgi:hypothetical protein